VEYNTTGGRDSLLAYVVYGLARAILLLFRALPRLIAVPILDFLALAIFCLDGRHRHIAQVNLHIAFPDLSWSQRNRIARRSFQNTARNLLEVSRLPGLTGESISKLVYYDEQYGLNNYHAALSKGRGILYMTGHFSAWELLPTAHALSGYPLKFLTRPLDNPPLERYLRRVREAAGNTVISRRNSARQILETIKSRGSVGILMDHNTTLQEGIFADLFGLPAATSTGLAIFALRTDAPIITGYLGPMHRGRYKIKFLPPIQAVHTGDMTRDIEVNTRIFNEVIERIIREQPESWLWGHKRWKNQPAGHPDLYRLSFRELDEFLAAKQKRPSGPTTSRATVEAL
jgi:Kdo2-lipid IVA lauroyltransferase/acyltransferase